MTAINHITETDILVFEAYGNINHYQETATKSAVYPGRGTPLGLSYCALKLNGEAGELAEHIGKAMRDDHLLTEFLDDDEATPFPKVVMRAAGPRQVYSYPSYEMTPERRELIIKEIGDCLWYLSALCNELGTTLAAVALGNLRKIASRSKRGTLRGSGDER